MNRLSLKSTTDAAQTLQSLDPTTNFPEGLNLPPLYAIPLQVNDFFRERVERTLSQKSFSPDKVAVIFKLGDAMIGFSSKELYGTNKEKNEQELKNFYVDAVDALQQDLRREKLTQDTALTAHILFVQRLESGTAFLGQVATCSSHNYTQVTTTTGQNFPPLRLYTFIKNHYTTGGETDKENDLLSFLFPMP